MKRVVSYLAALAIAGLLFVACEPAVTENEFDKTFLYSGSGEWVSTQTIAGEQHEIHDKFLANGTGSTWSVTDGALPQSFTWSMRGETLTFIHNMEMRASGLVPKEYTVVTLTETRLVYEDSWGTRISCTKR